MIQPLFMFGEWARSETARLAGVLSVIIGIAVMSGAFERWNYLIYDTALVLHTAPAPEDIVIVAIDDKSLRQLGHWPWSRHRHGELVERLTRYGAKSVALDIMFAESADADGGDRHLAGAIAANGTVVLPVFPDLAATGPLREVLPLPVLANVAAKLGHVDTELDRDSIARSVYLKAGLGSPVWPTLALAMLERVDPAAWPQLPGERRAASAEVLPDTWVRDHRLLLNFQGRPGRFREVSFVDVLRDDYIAASLVGKFVLVGATAAGLGKTLATPVSGEAQPMSGVEFNATVLDNLRRGNWILPVQGFTYAAMLSLFALLPALLYPRLSPRQGLYCAVAIAGASVMVPALLLQSMQWWFAPAPALLAAVCSYPLWSWRRIERSARVLRQERELARATLHAIGDAVVTTDLDGLITYMNPVAERLSEQPRREVIGRHISRIFWSASELERDKASQVIAQALAEHRPVRSPSYALLTRRLGDPYAVRITASPIEGVDGQCSGVVVALHDMTETLSLSRQVAHQATHDALTHLPNRELLADRLSQAIAAARRDGDLVAVLFLDLDGFKYINSSYGHAVGDELLIEVGARLGMAGRAHDTIARWDGDQFAILLTGLGQPETAGALARRFLDVSQEPFHAHEQEIHITGCIGISLFPRDAHDAETLFKHADAALHRVKQRERNGVGYYDDEYNVHAERRLALENELRQALRRDELALYYQPQLALVSGLVVGVEALLRWHHPEHGLVLPGVFIAEAEESELIHQIGGWVLRRACRQSAEWQRAGLSLQVSINVSARQLAKDDLVTNVRSALAAAGADPHRITLEITESAVMHDRRRAGEILHELKALGIRIAIDDFGTGYASLANLKQLPVDQVKVDQSFVRDIVSDPGDAAITQAVIAMAHSMGLVVIAEGVETSEQLDFLTLHQCDEMQGYFLSPAQPAAELEVWLRGQRLARDPEQRLDAETRLAGGPDETSGGAPLLH